MNEPTFVSLDTVDPDLATALRQAFADRFADYAHIDRAEIPQVEKSLQILVNDELVQFRFPAVGAKSEFEREVLADFEDVIDMLVENYGGSYNADRALGSDMPWG